jgi:hypothetical protein
MTRLSTTVAAEPAIDLAVVREMASEFEKYIVGDDVYRTLIVKSHRGEEMVKSSGGDLLARLHKVGAQYDELTPEQQHELENLRRRLDESFRDYRSRFHELLAREAKARLNSLKWFLDECRQDRRQCRIQYPFEIRNRQRIAEIWKLLSANPPEGLKAEIDTIDRQIRGMGQPADFVWDLRVRKVYPKDEYWYLYMLPVG